MCFLVSVYGIYRDNKSLNYSFKYATKKPLYTLCRFCFVVWFAFFFILHFILYITGFCAFHFYICMFGSLLYFCGILYCICFVIKIKLNHRTYIRHMFRVVFKTTMKEEYSTTTLLKFKDFFSIMRRGGLYDDGDDGEQLYCCENVPGIELEENRYFILYLPTYVCVCVLL